MVANTAKARTRASTQYQRLLREACVKTTASSRPLLIAYQGSFLPGSSGARRALLAAVVWSVMVPVTAAEEVTATVLPVQLGGLLVFVELATVQLRVTVPVYPPAGVTVMVALPLEPFATVSVQGEAERLNEAAPDWTIDSITALEVLDA